MADPNQPRKKKKREKVKEKKIEINLYVNGVAYEYGVICGFCTKEPAIWHCPECPDFYCLSCDTINHSVKKRKHHIRKMLSKLTKDAAAKLITHAVRYHGHLRLLQIECKKVFRRYFDPATLNHYYFNPIYGTVSWTKPYCLRKLELVPFITTDEAASRMQVLYRMWRARQTVIKLLRKYYRKVFDRRRGKFYYAFLGKSNVIPKQSWKKPRYFGKRGYFKDITPIYTADIAALTIQRKWRAVLVRRFFYALIRASFEQQWDAVNGKFTYYHRDSETMWENKPKLLGNQPWDPNYVPDWDLARVRLFFRRIGLKQYLGSITSYDCDGRALCLLDKEDFDNMGIFNKVHIRKIRVELEKIYTPTERIQKSELHEYRRERIKRLKMTEAAAIIIQKYFRRFSAKRELHLRRELRKTELSLMEVQAALRAMGTWYTERKDIPSNTYYIPDTDKISAGVEIPAAQQKFLETIKFPPIKTFGKRQDYLSTNGWGRRDTKGNWLPLLAAKERGFIGDAHPTRIYTNKLADTGYDNRRLAAFYGARKIRLEDTIQKRQVAVQKVPLHVQDNSKDDDSLAPSVVASVFSYHSENQKQVVELDPNLDVLL